MNLHKKKGGLQEIKLINLNRDVEMKIVGISWCKKIIKYTK